MLPADLPELIGGKYKPRSVLGSGATGTVYSVEHSFTGELLALKVMKSHLGGSPDAIARFKREARAASKIRSQHVVRIFDADVAPELGGVPYLVMDLLEGSDLEQVSGERPVDPGEVVEWLRQVAAPLDKAHRLGIVHRDLKPENLFLTRLEDGTPIVKILDFGIAKIAAESPGTTQSGQLFGTPQYMAPEQARGDLTLIGPGTDLFALGHIAYRLLVGVGHRTGDTLTDVLHEILHEPLRPPSEKGCTLGPEFDAWFLRACQSDPAHRFGSAHDQVEALAQALGLPPEPEQVSGPSSTGGSRKTTARDAGGVVQGNGVSLTSLRPLAVEAGESDEESAATGPRVPTLPGSGDGRGSDPAKQDRWRRAFFAASVVLAGLALLGIAVSWGRVTLGSPPPKSSACAVESGSAPVALAPSPGPAAGSATVPLMAPASVAASLVAAPHTNGDLAKTTSSAYTVAAEHETARAPTPRPFVPRAVAPRRTTDDDPLSDQR